MRLQWTVSHIRNRPYIATGNFLVLLHPTSKGGRPVRFHDYKTFRSLCLVRPDGPWVPKPSRLEEYRRMNSKQFCIAAWEDFRDGLNIQTEHDLFDALQKSQVLLNVHHSIRQEVGWHQIERPFYNVWPIAIELIQSVTLDVPWAEVRFPYRDILFRFAEGHEPHGMSCVLVHDYSQTLQDPGKRSERVAMAQRLRPDKNLPDTRGAIEAIMQFTSKPFQFEPLPAVNSVGCDGHHETVEETLRSLQQEGREPQIEFVYRLAVFAALLAKGQDLITPVILSKDRDKYEVADDEQRKWLEDRAARIQGRGFDLGKSLQQEKDSCPHWRNPHLCLFWTGPGRGEPLLKVRRGGVVVPKKLSEVPTGFLGAETPEELAIGNATFVRVPISARLRFEILRRDSYRCQMCGCTATDGVRLHIDHRSPVSHGGTNTVDNLWTLCEPCNLGKSNLPLSEPAEGLPNPLPD